MHGRLAGEEPPAAVRAGSNGRVEPGSDSGGGELFDVIVIGSGFGGAMAAYPLVRAGLRVLMIERGDWVPRGSEHCDAEGVGFLTPFYSTETPYTLRTGARRDTAGAFHCVGGQSVFYGAAALRYRERDFEPDAEIVGDSAARWPYRYADLERHYGRAEALLGVRTSAAGGEGGDPTEPPRSAPYEAASAPELSDASRSVERAARELGLSPFRLPLAVDPTALARGECTCERDGSGACTGRTRLDVASRVMPELLRLGLRLATNTVAVRLVTEGRRVAAVRCVDRTSGRTVHYRARQFVLAAGTLASPHLLLASELDRLNPAGDAVIGRYLIRHRNAMVFGLFPRPLNAGGHIHKQIGIHDYYFGHPSVRYPKGKLGGIQQVGVPSMGLARSAVESALRSAAARRTLSAMLELSVPYISGLLILAEDQPRPENRVTIDRTAPDRYGMPRLTVHHRYTERDIAAARALTRVAKRVLRRAGALVLYTHAIETFSHALGTVRMGVDPHTSALDGWSRFRGVENLCVTDGSCMPTSAGVNPSLTIAANALRAGECLALRMAAEREAGHAAAD
ncbi:MAG TPA: GMC family oxidoreductase [Gemmatimonadaceae bacterium]|nr:GMC family oxidoreductase [Gemmatimonadaceae bacterium]